MTKMTARPMPVAVSIFLETPKKGQQPINFTSTKFSIRMAPRANENNSVKLIGYSPFFRIFWNRAMTQPRVKKPPAGRIIMIMGS